MLFRGYTFIINKSDWGKFFSKIVKLLSATVKSRELKLKLGLNYEQGENIPSN